jgi:uncharacterized lipoprotein YbaY
VLRLLESSPAGRPTGAAASRPALAGAVAALLVLTACAGAKHPVPAPPPPTPTATPPPPTPIPPTPAPTPSPRLLEGGWDRAIRTGVAGREGFVLAPGGRLSLLGIFSMQGVSWRLDGDTLVLTTSTERYPEPIETRLRVEELTPTRLVLSGPGYLAGSFERRAVGSIEGEVTYRQRVALTPEAIVQVELRDVTHPDAEAPLLAKRVIHTDGRQVPIPFALDYDAAAVQKGHSYAVSARIADRGQLQYVTDTPVTVLGGEEAAPAEILVVPVH